MTIIEDAVKSFALAHLLPLVGVLFSACILGYGALHLYGASRYSAGRKSGKQEAADSTMRVWAHRTAQAESAHVRTSDSLHTLLQHTDSTLAVQRTALETVPRYQPTIDPLPDSITDVQRLGKVRVIVAATNDTINDVPLRAARYWFVSDSVAYAEHLLIGRYAAANRTWHDAWVSENQARIGADSLAAAYAARLRSVELVPRAGGASWEHRAVEFTLAAVVGAVVHNNVRHR